MPQVVFGTSPQLLFIQTPIARRKDRAEEKPESLCRKTVAIRRPVPVHSKPEQAMDKNERQSAELAYDA
jgi:hypothetical protein